MCYTILICTMNIWIYIYIYIYNIIYIYIYIYTRPISRCHTAAVNLNAERQHAWNGAHKLRLGRSILLRNLLRIFVEDFCRGICPISSYSVQLCPILPYFVLFRPIPSNFVLFCPISHYFVLFCPILSYFVTPKTGTREVRWQTALSKFIYRYIYIYIYIYIYVCV